MLVKEEKVPTDVGWGENILPNNSNVLFREIPGDFV
jgi:hypothetical protein